MLTSDSNFDFEKERGAKDVDNKEAEQKCKVDHLPLEGPECDEEANKNGDIFD